MIAFPAASTWVSAAVDRAPGEDASEQRERVIEYTEHVRAERGLERDAELRGHLRAHAAEWLD